MIRAMLEDIIVFLRYVLKFGDNLSNYLKLKESVHFGEVGTFWYILMKDKEKKIFEKNCA